MVWCTRTCPDFKHTSRSVLARANRRGSYPCCAAERKVPLVCSPGYSPPVHSSLAVLRRSTLSLLWVECTYGPSPRDVLCTLGMSSVWMSACPFVRSNVRSGIRKRGTGCAAMYSPTVAACLYAMYRVRLMDGVRSGPGALASGSNRMRTWAPSMRANDVESPGLPSLQLGDLLYISLESVCSGVPLLRVGS